MNARGGLTGKKAGLQGWEQDKRVMEKHMIKTHMYMHDCI